MTQLSPGVDSRQLQFSVESTSSTRSRLSKYFLKTLLNPFCSMRWRNKKMAAPSFLLSFIGVVSLVFLSSSLFVVYISPFFHSMGSDGATPPAPGSPHEIIDVRMGTCEISPVASSVHNSVSKSSASISDVWDHVEEIIENGKTTWFCKHCKSKNKISVTLRSNKYLLS